MLLLVLTLVLVLVDVLTLLLLFVFVLVLFTVELDVVLLLLLLVLVLLTVDVLLDVLLVSTLVCESYVCATAAVETRKNPANAILIIVLIVFAPGYGLTVFTGDDRKVIY